MSYTSIFFQAFVYLLATVITVPIAKRIGFGSVLGYLLAGIIIGPYVLGLVGNASDSVMHFAEFGVVMMLFLVGLELRPAMLWSLRRPLLITGGLQVILTTLVIGGIAKLFGLSAAASLAIGMIFTSSSTAIVLQLLNEKGWIKLEAGSTIFAVLLFQDIAVIPMLAIFPLLSSASVVGAESGLAGWQQALLIIGLILLIVVGGKYLLRPIFRFIASSRINEAFTAMALLLVIGTALAMQFVGLSPALGAFLAGVVLAESEYRHELEADIEPFKGLLLGLFFISVGANINFPLISEHLALILGLVILLMFLKFAVIFLLGKACRRPLRDNLLIAMTLAQGGEFCFVLISFSLQQKILDTVIVRELVAVVALSMLLTPLMMLGYEKIIEPRLSLPSDTKESDVAAEDNPVLVAGFGRFGQIVARFMMANGVGTTILDIDANQVESMRRFGFKVYFGDASRLDLLQIAGIERAKILVIAIDDAEKCLKVADEVRRVYPHVKILMRVRNRVDLYEAMHSGYSADDVFRETFDSSLMMAGKAYRLLGFTSIYTDEALQRFRDLDRNNLEKLYKLYNGKMDDSYISQVRQNTQELENILNEDKHTATRPW
jgi:monovalent cation:proton antiporter-2 (CPA2) family protein